MTAPQLTIVPIDGGQQIQDENGSVFGTYGTREQAETAILLWYEYYAAPLVYDSH